MLASSSFVKRLQMHFYYSHSTQKWYNATTDFFAYLIKIVFMTHCTGFVSIFMPSDILAILTESQTIQKVAEKIVVVFKYNQ